MHTKTRGEDPPLIVSFETRPNERLTKLQCGGTGWVYWNRWGESRSDSTPQAPWAAAEKVEAQSQHARHSIRRGRKEHFLERSSRSRNRPKREVDFGRYMPENKVTAHRRGLWSIVPIPARVSGKPAYQTKTVHTFSASDPKKMGMFQCSADVWRVSGDNGTPPGGRDPPVIAPCRALHAAYTGAQ